MSEERDRPVSFAEAKATTTMGAIEDASTIESWLDNAKDNLNDAVSAAAEQTEDKGFWGNLVTIGSTVGCMALDLATGGTCTIAGLALGTAARIAVDATDDAEKQVPGEAVGPDVDYYRNKIPGLVDDLNEGKEKLDNFHANEWKRDVLLQLGDTFTAVQIGAEMDKLGIFSESLSFKMGEEVAASTVDSIFEPTLFTELPTNLT